MAKTSAAPKTLISTNKKRPADSNPSVLRRYTTLASLIHILRTKQITLISPSSWDDKNDAFFMNEYKNQKGALSVLALCFSKAPETYHHWKVFTQGSEGVCIEFESGALLSKLKNENGLRAEDVDYKRIDALEAKKPLVNALPFLKRLPYGDEREFRLVYLSDKPSLESKGFPLALRSIRQITLSPWMPKDLVTTLKATIKSMDGCSNLKVIRTTLLENERWKSAARDAQRH
jgi:hypothetical protein